jgi:FlgD Ig-like domain/WD40-like Beta Propeller Repeat
MNGMKKLLGVVAILILAGALLPGQSQAAWRGSVDIITYGDFPNGPDQISLRPAPVDGPDWNLYWWGDNVSTERWMAVTTRSLVGGSQAVREMYLYWNSSFLGFYAPLLLDPAAQTSYVDPAWSPDGKWLAYVKTDKLGSKFEIYIQQFGMDPSGFYFDFDNGEAPDIATATSHVDAPVLVQGAVPGQAHRHPSWSPDGKSLVYDSNVTGLSIDLYTIPVLDAMGSPAVGAPTRITFNNAKAEKEPAWSPDGTRIAYSSNEFGAFAPKILVLSTVPNPTDGYIADQALYPTSYLNIGWSHVPGENVLYFSVPLNGDPNGQSTVYRMDLDTQQKCAFFDRSPNSMYDPEVSTITNLSGTTPFNYVNFIQNLAFDDESGNVPPTYTSLGAMALRSNYLQMCQEPMQVGVNFSPQTLNLGSGGPGSKLTMTLNFPPDVEAQGYSMYPNGDVGGKEGIMLVRSFYFPSPVVNGRRLPGSGSFGINYKFNNQAGTLDLYLSRRWAEAWATDLGLVNKLLPIEVSGYTHTTGRQYKGIGYLTVTTSSLAGSAVTLLQNSPNPFNPHTKIAFAVNKPGEVDVRVFNVRGELVKTLAKQWYPQGQHTVTWDGSTDNGAGAPSGMYFAVAKSNGSTDRMKMMLMK